MSNEYRYAAGGKGANQAFAVSKLGGEAYMVGRVGNDDNGKSLLKLGSRGAYLYSDTVRKIISCFKVEAVDTTAAGDTFGAAFCVEYNTRKSIDNAVRYAHAAAAICVTRKGGQPSIPTREETDLFLSSKI